MQIGVPNSIWNFTMNSEHQECRTSVPRCCPKCKKVCDKPLQLPECGHLLCKRCLNDYFSSLISWTDELDDFACPQCGETVKKPIVPTNKWSKAFSIKKKAKFYTNKSDDPQGQKEADNGNNCVTERKFGKQIDKTSIISSDGRPEFGKIDTGNDFVRVRETSTGKSISLHRTAVRFSGQRFAGEFNSKIRSDEKDCLHFGGDVMPNGNIILADWLNFSVKLFESSGHFICSSKMEDAPLDVTVLRNDMIVISFGSTCRKVQFMTFIESSQVLETIWCNSLPGFLYSTTKYEDRCVGIFERDGKQPSIVRLSLNWSKGKTDSSRRRVIDFIIPDSDIELSSESGIFYNHKDSRLYVTSGRKLLCFNEDRKLIFNKRFQCVGANMYFLGSVTCDDKGMTYVASDNCILRVTKDGDLIAVVPTKDDPYHILMKNDQRMLVLTRKETTVECTIKLKK